MDMLLFGGILMVGEMVVFFCLCKIFQKEEYSDRSKEIISSCKETQCEIKRN